MCCTKLITFSVYVVSSVVLSQDLDILVSFMPQKLSDATSYYSQTVPYRYSGDPEFYQAASLSRCSPSVNYGTPDPSSRTYYNNPSVSKCLNPPVFQHMTPQAYVPSQFQTHDRILCQIQKVTNDLKTDLMKISSSLSTLKNIVDSHDEKLKLLYGNLSQMVETVDSLTKNQDRMNHGVIDDGLTNILSHLKKIESKLGVTRLTQS